MSSIKLIESKLVIQAEYDVCTYRRILGRVKTNRNITTGRTCDLTLMNEFRKVKGDGVVLLS
jgi:hypothetical protein